MWKKRWLLSRTDNFARIIRFCCISSLLLIFISSQAQIISPVLNEAKSLVISFNAPFIKANKIKSITKHISSKPDNQMIIDKGLMEYYEFDTAGNLIYSFTTAIKATTENEVLDYTYTRKGKRVPFYKTEYSYLYDTTFVFYTYDNKNRMTIKRNSIIGREVFRSHYYEYNDSGVVKKETVIREVNSAENIRDFKTGMQTVLSIEGFTYEKIAPGQTKKKFLNDEGRVYKEGVVYSNDKGQVTEEAFDFVVTWIKERNTYKYNPKGYLLDKKLSSNDGYSSHESFEYDPGEADTFNGIHLFKDGVKTKDISYIYDKTTRFLESDVSRDHKNASIAIARYVYDCY